MAKIENNILETLSVWYGKARQLAELKREEGLMRRNLVVQMFVQPKEGVNKYELPNGYTLNVNVTINRKVDESLFNVRRAELVAAGVNTDEVFKVKLELSKSHYNKLNDEQKALVDSCLVITDGSPQFEVKPPKGTK